MTDLEQAKHVFQAIILTAIADGQADGMEAQMVGKLRKENPFLEELSDIREIGLEIKTRAEHIGAEPALRAVAAGIKDRDYRETAFRLCAQVMGADGETDMEEAELLGTLQELWEFTPADVKRLLSGK